MDPVTDPRDVRVLIPRVRRAIDGPTATASAAVSASLTDDMMVGLIADAAGELILYSGGSVFGHELVVTERDTLYLAPIAWILDPVLNEIEEMAITSQAALNYFFFKLHDIKTMETISDEGVSWSYQLSATALRDWIKILQDARDKALEALASAGAVLDSYVSFVAERDFVAASYIEPWVPEVGASLPYHGGGGALPGGQWG